MPAENESPAREPATRGRGRGGRGGRGARGRGGSRLAASAAASTVKYFVSKPGRGGSRRGRAKSFADSRVQGAYERQRDLKAQYQAVALTLRSALQELAERSVDDVLQNPDRLKTVPEHHPIVLKLQHNLDHRLTQHGHRRDMDLKLAKDTHDAEVYVAEREFQNAVNDIVEQFYEGQENRIRILNAISLKGLPVDVRDDQYQYKIISDVHLDRDFGIYESYKNGHLVPYPSRVPGTEMWKRGRIAADAASAPAPSNATAKGGRGRGRGVAINKRRAQEQPDGQPTPKKSTRGSDDAALVQQRMAPAPAKGLLASAAEAEAHPNGVAEEESMPASPEPAGLTNGTSAAAKDPSKLHAREKSPPLPKNIGEPDEYGIRLYNQRGPREKAMTSRFMAPPIFTFNDWEIGFRDTSNDSSKGHTRAKRGKYLDTPNNTGWHFDHWCNGYDFSSMKPGELDKELVERHGLHPKYGIFLPTSKNDLIESDPYNIPGKPVVFIATPSGRVSYASRSFIPTMNHRRSEEAPFRLKFAASLRRFCKMADIQEGDVSIAEYLPSFNEWKKKSLGTAVKEMKKRPIVEIGSETEEEVKPEETNEAVDTGISAMSVLTYASAYVAAQETPKTAPPPPKQARYDAIRDVFTNTGSSPPSTTRPEPAPLGLNTLAELCNVEARLPGGTVVTFESEYRNLFQKEETPQASSFGHLPPSQRAEHQSPYGYSSRDRAYPQPPASGTIPESSPYPPLDRGLPPPAPMDYKSHYPPPPGPISQDPGYYYAPHDPRDSMAPGRPMDHGYGHRRLSAYGSEAPPPPQSYSRGPYWPQPPTAPHPPISQPTHYGAPPPPPSRLSFSQANDPLPPLRPPRRQHSMPDEPMHDSQRSSIHGGIYYPPGPARSYQRSGFPTEPLAPLQLMSGERLLPNPQAQGYMGSPPPGYTHQVLSPTFGNPGLPGNIGQSPPGTPQGPHSGIHRHRSTPSGSSDAGSNKYRKLQPAPVPAHRNWANKPELKTIPYDHKETGSSAALPSSGPTQIRGWNVNQPRKRSKAEKQERAESNNDRDDSR